MALHILACHPEIDAALSFSDFVALGFAAGLQACLGPQSGRRIPLVGFDDIEEARHAIPPISSVHCGISHLAAITANRALAWLDGEKPPAPVERTPAQFIAREAP